MSIQDSIGVYDQAEFAENPEPRCSIVLILDVSGSMCGEPLETVNRALVKFRDIIREDPVTALRADVAIIVFSTEAGVAQDFTSGVDFNPPVLDEMTGSYLGGGTNFDAAINLALNLIEARKRSYRDGGIAYYRSLAYFLTDGYGEMDRGTVRRLADMERNRSVAFFTFLVSAPPNWDGLDDATKQRFQRVHMQGHLNKLSELSELLTREPVSLTNMEQLEGSIEWLSRSVAAVSQSQPGDSIRLPEPDYLGF